MHPWRTLLAFSALAACGCTPAQEQPQPAPSERNAVGMLEIAVGEAAPQFAGAADETAIQGVVVMGAPLVNGPLSGTFYDYSAQVDARSKRVVAVSASRVFSSLSECQKHFDSTLALVKAKYKFDSQTAVGPSSLEAASGPLKINLLCSFNSGAIHPTLWFSVANRALAIAARRRPGTP